MSSSLKGKPESKKQGVILLQIDGLARFQFERALRANRMPYLAKLLKGKSHAPISFYPGQPSCTPAVQAELHYGIPCATPAFSFYDRNSSQEVRMYDAEWARRIAAESSQQGDGLLEGGSSYANIYRGGASKSKYCGELNTFSDWTKELSLFRWGKLAAKNPMTTLRICKLLGIEIAIGFYDAIRGITTRGDLKAELTFIPARLGVAIALREAIRSEALEDIKNGLPIIHANFFGYDEAAHRRGPHSRFAHWTLKGIDHTIRKISRAAGKSRTRDYRVIIFSDHGQEHCTPYYELANQTLAEATRDLFCGEEDSYQLQPASLVGAFMERSKSLIQELAEPQGNSPSDKELLHLQAMGPVAHLYSDKGLSAQQKLDWSRRYCSQAQVPVVLYLDTTGDTRCITAEREGRMELLGELLDQRGHEFAEQTVQDLEALMRSKYAGELVLLGWRSNSKPITFADERGAHAGPGAEECRGFVLLPSKIECSKSWIRPSELRDLCLQELGRQTPPIASHHSSSTSLRVLTYNVHGGVGTDRKRDADRLAGVIKRSEADVLCFQEAFESADDPNFSLQASIEKAWPDSSYYTFLPLHEKKSVRYGLAIASRLPFRIHKSEAFQLGDHRLSKREPRGAIWIEVSSAAHSELHIVNTHLGLKSSERIMQSKTLLSEDWLGALPSEAKRIVCGDLNAGPRGAAYVTLADQLVDAPKASNPKKPSASFYSLVPTRRIDHIFSSPSLRAIRSGVVNTAVARKTSDHLPVYADFVKG